jgi:hypothetical protein
MLVELSHADYERGIFKCRHFAMRISFFNCVLTFHVSLASNREILFHPFDSQDGIDSGHYVHFFTSPFPREDMCVVSAEEVAQRARDLIKACFTSPFAIVSRRQF